MSTVESDREHLHSLGYAQELHRGLGTFSNFAISFSIISILAGGMTSYWLGMVAGGPRVIMLGWVIVGFFALLVGMSMGEICSTYSTAGGLYYWSAKLAKKNGPAWSWFTGWFNLVGQIGVIASVDYALAIFIGFFIRSYDSSFRLSTGNIFLIFCLVLIAHGLLNTFGVNLVRLLGDISVWWHVTGVVIIFLFLLIAPSSREGFSFIFKERNLTGWTGGVSTVYTFMIGLLLAQYTITGFDASAHVSEETFDARTSAPKAIVRAIYISAIAALLLNLAMTQAMPKGSDAYSAVAFGGGGDTFYVNAAPRLITAAIGGAGAKFLILISIVAQFFCGMMSVTANSRMIYAFSRDGGLPLSRIWHKINPKTRTPTNSVWLGVVLSAIVGTTSFAQKGGYSTAFFALTGITVVGLYIAYVIPIFLRLRDKDFVKGPWHLGRWSHVVGWTSVAWVIFVTIIFFVPPFWPFWPITGKDHAADGSVSLYYINNFNFTGPLIVGAFILFGAWYVLSAHKWFTGPKVQGTREELLAIEHELDAISH